MSKFVCCCVFVLLGNSFALPADNDRESRSGFGFQNSDNIRTFNSDFDNQQRALEAAQKAFDLTSMRAGFNGYNPSFDFRFPEFPPMPMPSFQGFRNFGSDMSMGPNSAIAFGAIGPDFKHQMAAINPDNPTMKNVEVFNRFAETPSPSGFKSVSSFSSSVSKNVNGKPVNERVAETVVNDNGKVTKYSVHS